MSSTHPKNSLYAGLVWILAAAALGAYGVLLFTNTNIPGMEDLINFLTTVDPKYIYIAAVVSVFIEGLYFIGSFFPGSSLVMGLAILSQTSGPFVLITTLFLIFCGWCVSGLVNIYTAKLYRSKVIKQGHHEDYRVEDRVWTTWFPAFRASYEVAQVTEGGHPMKVFVSSLRVRFWATLAVGILAVFIPFFVDIRDIGNEEGFVIIAVIIIINLWVGISKIRQYYTLK